MPSLKWFCVLTLPALFAVTLTAAPPRPLILTSDCGADMDDQWALAHLIISPEFHVLAVVTTHTGSHPILAPPAAESSARIAREVLAHIPVSHAPVVIPGSSVPLKSRTALPNPGVDRILKESRNFTKANRLTVLVIGAATDTASALLTDPTLSDRIQIIAMGFKSWEQGGNEFNITNDPLAWQVILDSNTPVTVGDAAVTSRDLAMTSQHAHALLDPDGAPGRYLAGLLDQWLAKRSDVVMQVTNNPKIWPVWDEVTVAQLLGLTKAEERPRPKMRLDLSFDHAAGSGRVNWVTSIDSARLWTDFADKLQVLSK